MGLRADSARSQRVSGSARTDSQRAESARNPIAANVKFGDDSALSAFTRTQWTAAFKLIFSGRNQRMDDITVDSIRTKLICLRRWGIYLFTLSSFFCKKKTCEMFVKNNIFFSK